MYIEVFSIAISAIATVLGALASVLADRAKTPSLMASLLEKLVSTEKPISDEAVAVENVTAGSIASPAEAGLKLRMREVRAGLRRQRALAITYRGANFFLTFGQFIVGGLLASSFLQEQLSKQMVGGLGLIVLASSLLRQHFRPDVELAGCLQRTAKLRTLLREAEDCLFSLAEGEENAPSITKIRKMLSNGLSAIEDSELRDVERIARSTATKQRKSKAIPKADNRGNKAPDSSLK